MMRPATISITSVQKEAMKTMIGMRTELDGIGALSSHPHISCIAKPTCAGSHRGPNYREVRLQKRPAIPWHLRHSVPSFLLTDFKGCFLSENKEHRAVLICCLRKDWTARGESVKNLVPLDSYAAAETVW